MFEPSRLAKFKARELIRKSLVLSTEKGQLKPAEINEYNIEVPADVKNGDLSSNVALVSAKAFGMPPRKIAETIVENIEQDKDFFESVSVAGPGFINFFLSQKYYSFVLSGILEQKDNFGNTDYLDGEKVMIEFVSANPTGPMHLGNARGGALGDCLASIISAAGANVTKEFYVNDAGNQIDKFAKSLDARYLALYKGGVEFPEDGYHGKDIIERAKQFAEINGDSFVNLSEQERHKALVDFALPKNVEGLKNDLLAYRIEFDNWFLESSLYKADAINKIVNILKQKDLIYEKDGATWYKASTVANDDEVKDEVLIRSNGFPTYFAADIAYHYNKFSDRGFNRVINVWGADHHGHVARIKGAMDAVGLSGDKLDIVLMQLVRLMQDGEPVRMSKRTGNAITLSDLLDEVPVDAARFFFNLREPKSHLDFDLTLAAKRSSDNPVYYVQYAHARICSIIKSLKANDIDVDKAESFDFSTLSASEEIMLLRRLSELPFEIQNAANEYDPARLTRYVIDVATLFHKFYTACRVKDEAEEVMYPRIAICLATRQVLKNCLTLLKIDAPESM